MNLYSPKNEVTQYTDTKDVKIKNQICVISTSYVLTPKRKELSRNLWIFDKIDTQQYGNILPSFIKNE